MATIPDFHPTDSAGLAYGNDFYTEYQPWESTTTASVITALKTLDAVCVHCQYLGTGTDTSALPTWTNFADFSPHPPSFNLTTGYYTAPATGLYEVTWKIFYTYASTPVPSVHLWLTNAPTDVAPQFQWAAGSSPAVYGGVSTNMNSSGATVLVNMTAGQQLSLRNFVNMVVVSSGGNGDFQLFTIRQLD